MILSFIVSDMYSTAYLINSFSEVIDGYSLERNPMTGEPELLVLYITEGFENDALEIKELVETMAVTLSEEVNTKQKKAIKKGRQQ